MSMANSVGVVPGPGGVALDDLAGSGGVHEARQERLADQALASGSTSI